MINLTMRYPGLLEKAIAQGSIVTARTSIPKELKPKDGVYPSVPVTLWLKKGDETKLHATGVARIIYVNLYCGLNGFERFLEAGFESVEAWYAAFRSFHPRWTGGTVYFVEIAGIEERSA